MSQIADRWAAASTYEQFMGRWSRALAREFLSWLQPAAGAHWLELGCGTGALTRALCAQAAPATVVACDPAQPFIDFARASIADDRVQFMVAGADDFPLRTDGYDAITSLLALNFFPQPRAALGRMRAATRAGGVISACVWDYAEGMQFLRYFWDCANDVSGAARSYDEGVRFPICTVDKLRELFASAGLADVRCDAIEIGTAFASFDDYWQPLTGGTGPAPSFVASLAARDRALLRQKLEARLPTDATGSIALRARAWAACGVRV